MKVTVRPRQTLSDIAVQVYGDISAVPLIAKANAISITENISPGTCLECPEHVYDQYMQDYVKNNRISPATAPDMSDEIYSPEE